MRISKKHLRKILLRISILLALSLLGAFVISSFFSMGLARALEIVGFIVLAAGVLPLIGGMSVDRDYHYNLTNMTVNPESHTKDKSDLREGRYDFTIFMIGAGGIILLLSFILSKIL